MDVEVYHKLIDELAEINFRGRISPQCYGEPLLDKRLTALMKYTREKLPKVRLVVISNGDALTIEKFNELVNAGVDKFSITQHGESMSENMKKLFDYLKDYPKEMKRIRYNRFDSKTPLSNRGGLVKPETLDTTPRCTDPGNPVTIDYAGNVILCCHDYLSTVKFGNIKDQKLLDIWFSDKYKNLRKQLRKKQYKLPICLKCIGKVEPDIN
ncbi:putative S-adenosyl-L-methionine-dependent 2-deoxy-scyllo-inosamine dehydrogenase [Candidatus Magnetomoraceae bacterium gMMP-1]